MQALMAQRKIKAVLLHNMFGIVCVITVSWLAGDRDSRITG